MTSRASSEPSACRVPPELLFDILDTLPARNLVLLRLVSRDFADTANALLRARLLHIVHDPTQELVFESSRPAEYRKTHCQRIEFGDFVPIGEGPCVTEVARFVLPSNPSISQFLPLEDDEAFGTCLLSVHIRGVEPPEDDESATTLPLHLPALASPPLTPASTPPGFNALHWALSSAIGTPPGRQLPITPASTPPRGPPSVSFSLSLAEGLERLYRTWFENPNAQPRSTTTAACPRKTKPQTLYPTGSALRSARIECQQVEPSVPFAYPTNVYGSGTYVPMRPTLFEFSYKSLELDVGKLISGVEEGLDREEHHGPIILWMMR